MNTNRTIVVALIVIAAAVMAWHFTTPPSPTFKNPESIVIGQMPDVSSGLIYIADDQHFFAKNGLNVTVRDYETGIAGVRAVEQGEIEIARVAEYPVAGLAFTDDRIRILGTISSYQDMQMIGRRDRGIANISDLRGKKIGVLRGSIPEFYLGRFLNLHGLGLQDVNITAVADAESPDAIINGKVDAVLIRKPYADTITERMGKDVTVWPGQSSQPGYSILVSTRDWVDENPETAKNILLSMDNAYQFSMNHPEEARAIVQKRLQMEGPRFDSASHDIRFTLSLDQSLVLAMEDESRWMIANNLTNATVVPDFGKVIYPDALESVRPGSVNVIR